MSGRPLGPATVLGIAAAGLLTWAGCESALGEELVYETVAPGLSTMATVKARGEHAGYLDVEVRTAGRELRFYLDAADASCREIAAGAAQAEYLNVGTLGRLRSADLQCDPVGILALREWRDRRPRRRGSEPLPRSRASYRAMHRDSDVALLRGRFGLAGELGWAVGVDSIVVVERGRDCDPLLDEAHASMEYRAAGAIPLVLLGPDGPCPVLGLVRPLPAAGF